MNQIVVELLVAVPNEAEHIEIYHPRGELLQLLDGVVIDERGVVANTIVRDPQFG